MKERVLVYGAGLTARKLFPRICEKYSPVCFLDRDAEKQKDGFFGFPVLAPDKGLAEYPHVRILLAVSHFLKYDITEWLLEQGISVEQIIGAQGPVERRWGCAYLEQYIGFWHGEMRHCCSLANTYHLPFKCRYAESPFSIYHNYTQSNGRLISALQDDTLREKYCGTCRLLKYGSWPQHLSFCKINISIESPCNYNCVYCGESDGEYGGCTLDDGTSMRAALDFLNYCKETGKLDDFAEVWLAPGEPSIHPMLPEILDILGDYSCTIATNASVYSEPIASVLKRGMSEIRVSIDAGTPETYARVRGVAPKMFDTARKNLLRYAGLCADGIELQYIILPGRNTEDRDIDGFCELAEELRARVLISRDRNHIGDIDGAAAASIVRMRQRLEANGIRVRLFSDAILSFSNEELLRIKTSAEEPGKEPQ